MVAVAFLFAACNNDSQPINQEQEIDMSDFYAYTDADGDEAARQAAGKGKGKVKSCHTMVLLNKELNSNPGLEKKMYDIEYHTRKIIASKKPDGAGKPGGGNNGGGDPTPVEGPITIPVYVHIIYQSDSNYITDSQVNSQIAILNDDFSNSNSDINNVPSRFVDNIGNANIQFTLAGITRTQNGKSSWPINNTMKYASSGGHNVVTPETHLNIWVVNIFDGNGTLGFAYLPGTAPAGADGVVIASPYFGNEGTAGSIYPEFGLGRTTTHEVGHYLNLRHIWGDGRCRQDDLVSDTPPSDSANFGCPSSEIVKCKSVDMTMNYMDYVDDACMYMYSQGQVDRMRANFATGGERESMLP